MTEDEMSIVRNILYDCGELLVCFDERTADKKLLFVTADELAMLRYIIASPVFTQAEKDSAQSTLKQLLAQEAEGRLRPSGWQLAQHLFEADDVVLYRAPDDADVGGAAS